VIAFLSALPRLPQKEDGMSRLQQTFSPSAVKKRRALEAARFEATRRWQDELLLAIMECDAPALATALDAHGERALHAVLKRTAIGIGVPFFVLEDQAYPRVGAMRDVIGGSFAFEDEERRALISSWLDMIGARSGDTMLHLILRLNGAEDERKAACAVQLLGRGIDWERVNNDNYLPSMVDGPAFKEAFFRALPRWREEQRKLQAVERVRAAERARKDALQRERDAAAAAALVRRARWAEVVAQAEEEKRKERERDRFHTVLQDALVKLERRETREARGERGGDWIGALNALPTRAERWLRGVWTNPSQNTKGGVCCGV
jgi:hypothetical protein